MWTCSSLRLVYCTQCTVCKPLWAAKRSCKDPTCNPCKSCTWLHEEKKQAKREGKELPPCLLTKLSHQCRREGHNYSLQCLPCALVGVKSVYWGESSRSPRQRLKEHDQDCRAGLVTAPMVQHSLEAHGGTRPQYLGLIHQIEPKALYRVVHESVLISMMAPGITNINRCQEWGAPRVPVLSAAGGDPEDVTAISMNPRLLWSRTRLDKIKNKQLKQIQYWDEPEDDDVNDSGVKTGPSDPQVPLEKPCKRPRTDWDPDVMSGPNLEVGEPEEESLVGTGRVEDGDSPGPSLEVGQAARDQCKGGPVLVPGSIHPGPPSMPELKSLIWTEVEKGSSVEELWERWGAQLRSRGSDGELS